MTNSSRFVQEGITEALAKEVKDLGIKVTAIAPGSFRTEWAGRSMVRSGRYIPDYDMTAWELISRSTDFT